MNQTITGIILFGILLISVFSLDASPKSRKVTKKQQTQQQKYTVTGVPLVCTNGV